MKNPTYERYHRSGSLFYDQLADIVAFLCGFAVGFDGFLLPVSEIVIACAGDKADNPADRRGEPDSDISEQIGEQEREADLGAQLKQTGDYGRLYVTHAAQGGVEQPYEAEHGHEGCVHTDHF